MSTTRRMTPDDLFSLNLTNLDPLTENYDLHFYLSYLMKWPSLCSVVEDDGGQIIGYSTHHQHPYLSFVRTRKFPV
jgi:N-terminal acetyltransferase B complex catalytic subunit